MKYEDIKFGKDFFGLDSFYKIECDSQKLYFNLFQDKSDREKGKLNIPSGFLTNITYVEKDENYIYVKSKLQPNIYTFALALPMLIIIYMLFKFVGLEPETYVITILLIVGYLIPVMFKVIDDEKQNVHNCIIRSLYENRNK